MPHRGSKNNKPDATAYAYQGNWSVLQIVNLNAKRDKRMFKDQLDRVTFKAFVKSFKDSFNPGWQEVQYPNQSVPLAFQSMPRRSIQIEWGVPSSNVEEAIQNLQKISWLAQSMYPTLKLNSQNKNYSPKSTFMAVKFANLIQNNSSGPLPGYISGFSYSPNFTEGLHIINKAEASSEMKKYFAFEKGKYIFPNLVDLAIEFKPIQTRDSFGLVENLEQKLSWNDSSWPYGIQIDEQRYPKIEEEATVAEPDPEPDPVREAQKIKLVRVRGKGSL